MRKVLLFLVFCLLPFCFYGQTSYFVTDSVYSIGSKIIDNGSRSNAQFCAVETNNSIVQYTANKVKEYGFEDGRVYVSKNIHVSDSLQKVFLLRLVKGKLSLYYYSGKSGNTFFWEKDSTKFFELPKNHKDYSKMNFRDDLTFLTSDCENMRNATKLVSYNIKSLSELVRNYNDCKLVPFKYFRYGILFGLGINRLETSAENSITGVDFKYIGSTLPGVFIDYPINMSDFSLHADLNFTKSGYSYNSESYNNNLSLNQNIIFLANTSSINLPVLLRYTFPYMHIKPFLNVGLIYTYNIINSTAIYTSTIYPTYIETSTIDKTSLISKSQLGFSCGTGVEYKLNNRHAVFIELRYNKLHSSSSDYILNKSEFQIITGINI
jgi:opacity protein-like surface antigen